MKLMTLNFKKPLYKPTIRPDFPFESNYIGEVIGVDQFQVILEILMSLFNSIMLVLHGSTANKYILSPRNNILRWSFEL